MAGIFVIFSIRETYTQFLSCINIKSDSLLSSDTLYDIRDAVKSRALVSPLKMSIVQS